MKSITLFFGGIFGSILLYLALPSYVPNELRIIIMLIPILISLNFAVGD